MMKNYRTMMMKMMMLMMILMMITATKKMNLLP